MPSKDFNIVNYDNVYGLSAAICTAFIGISYIRDYLIDKIFSQITAMSEHIQTALIETEAASEQFKDYLKVNVPNSNKRKKIVFIIKKLDHFKSWCSNQQTNLSVSYQRDVIKYRLLALFSYVFFLHGSMIIIAGLLFDLSIRDFDVTYLLMIFDLAFIIGLGLLHLLDLKSPHNSFYLSFFVFSYLSIITTSFILYEPHRLESKSLFVSFLLFSFSFIPIVVLSVIVRTRIWLWITPRYILSKTDKNKRMIRSGNFYIALNALSRKTS